MERILEGSALPSLPNGSVVTVGTFDGVHRGHQALLAELRRRADEIEAPAVVVTFDRHPASVVRPESAPRLLSTLAQRLELFTAAGVDYVHMLRFDEARSLETPEDFMNDVVVGMWHARVAVEGENFHFGHRRRGDMPALEAMGARLGFKVHTVALVVDELLDTPISSEAIRAALARGDIDTTTRLLGREFEIQGVVEHGDKRGRELGFPTANVAVPGDIQLPADGVYAGWYERPDGSVHRTAISIGRRPTFYAENGLLLVEPHLLDFDDDLYFEHARVRIEAWLRGQVKFDSIDALIAQLEQDVEATRRLADS